MKIKLEIEIPDEVAEWNGWKGRRGRKFMHEFFYVETELSRLGLISRHAYEMRIGAKPED
jgi:UTP:GlnB (protein PII) uridylyltransferase